MDVAVGAIILGINSPENTLDLHQNLIAIIFKIASEKIWQWRYIRIIIGRAAYVKAIELLKSKYYHSLLGCDLISENCFTFSSNLTK